MTEPISRQWLRWPAALLIVLTPVSGRAQRTEVTDAGGGRKVELLYNHEDRVVESRTLDAAGNLEERIEYEYRPGFQAPEQTTTSYWPDGKTPHSQSRVEYDANANFTLQVDALFDKSGKQTAGNKLTHDPLRGLYRCYRWQSEATGFQPEACPKAEEESGGEESKAMTRTEVLEDLARARATLRQQDKLRRLQPKTPIRPPVTQTDREVGIVLPADPRPGERVSGSVVDDPDAFAGAPGLQVVRVKLPFDSQGAAATLAGWTFVAANGEPQHADGPVTFMVPRGTNEFNVTLYPTGNPGRTVKCAISMGAGAAPSTAAAGRGFSASPICFKGGLCPVQGAFSGDATRTLAAFGRDPAPIVAETMRVAYIRVPDTLAPDFTHLLVAEAGRAAALPVDVAQFELTPLGRELQQGQTLVMHAIVSGAEDLPDELWRSGAFGPMGSLEGARRLVPGFDPSAYGKDGGILAAVENVSGDAVAMRLAQNNTLVFELTPESFSRGEFKYNFVLEFRKSGGYALRATALPFLAPVTGREYALDAKRAAPAKGSPK